MVDSTSFDEFLEEFIEKSIKDQPELEYKDLDIEHIKAGLYHELRSQMEEYYPGHFEDVVLQLI